MLRAIYFDMGGTLDGEGHWLDRFVRLYAEHGFTLSRDAVRAGFDYAEQCAAADDRIQTAGIATLVQRHLEWQFAANRLDDDHRRTAIADAFVAAVRVAARCNARVLEQLHQRGLLLGVVSNACGNAQALCDDLGYSRYLSVVIDSRVVGVAKPDPRIYSLALARLGLAAGESMMVGDSYERDIVPAQQIGMQTCWFVPGGVPAGRGSADLCVASLDRLPASVPVLERTPA
jgi:putative hydrolase of the HAD superfamily